jgi:C1A family cysteine protease
MMILPKMILTITLLIISSYGMASITESECGNYDYSDRFPPVRDQNGVGYCWAFASAAVMEEELCLEKRQNEGSESYQCGDKLSVLDMSRCNFHIGTSYGSEGGDPAQALECVLSPDAYYSKYSLNPDKKSVKATSVLQSHQKGLCLEKLAPYNNLRKGLKGFVDGFRGIVDASSFNYTLERHNNKCLKAQEKNLLTSEQMEELYEHHAKILKKLLPNHEAFGVDFKSALKADNLTEEYLHDLLLTPECQKNSIEPNKNLVVKSDYLNEQKYTSYTFDSQKGSSSTEHVIPEKTLNEKSLLLRDYLKTGRSVVASICSEKYLADNKANNLIEKIFKKKTKSECGPHAVVYAGMKWDEKSQSCQVFVRNSWGSGSALNGWVSADRALKQTFEFTQLRSDNK